MKALRSRFLYEFRLGKPDEYLSDSIDTSGMEWLKLFSEGKIVYMSASLVKPMEEGPFKVGDVVPIASLFVTGRDLGRHHQYRIISLKTFAERRFMDVPGWEDAECDLTDGEKLNLMKETFEKAAYFLTHPDEFWEMMKKVKPIPDYIGYVRPTGKIDLEQTIDLDQTFRTASNERY
jgi:hypothetical protein